MPKQLLSAREKDYVIRQQVGRLATTDHDGQPHVVPVCYAFDGEYIFLHVDLDSRKTRNIKENSTVAFAIDEWERLGKYKGLTLQGEAKIIHRGPLFKKGRDEIYRKYTDWKNTYPITEGRSTLIRIRPRKVASWKI